MNSFGLQGRSAMTNPWKIIATASLLLMFNEFATGQDVVRFDREIASWRAGSQRIDFVDVRRDDTLALSVCGRSDEVIVWRLSDRKAVHRFHHEGLLTAHFSTDGRQIIIVCRDNISIISAVDGTVINRISMQPDHFVEAASCDSGGKLICFADIGRDAGGSGDSHERQCLRIWDLQKMTEIRSLTTRNFSGMLAISPDGALYK